MNDKVKNFLLGAWELLVFFCYLKFYIICLTTYAMVCVLSMFVISEAGGDVELLGNAINISMYFVIFYIIIIMIDRISKLYGHKEVKK